MLLYKLQKLHKGFTLIETIVVIAVVMILSAIAAPYFKHLIILDRLQAVAWQMVQDLREVREDAILYQQNLYVYFCVSPEENKNFYLFETFQKDPLHNTHYNPGNLPDGRHFIKRKLKYNVHIASCNFPSVFWVNGKKYYSLKFYCGAGTHFRGEAHPPGTITLIDPKSRIKFYVVVDLVGRIRMSGKHQ